MVWLEFTPEAKKELKQQWEAHPHPRVRKKLMVVYLKSQGMPHGKIAEVVGVSHNTVRHYLEQYERGGLCALQEIRFSRPKSELMEHKERIKEHLEQHPPRTAAEAAQQIEEVTGIRRSPERVGAFLRKIGLKYRHVRTVPAKASPEKQRRFL